MQELDNQNDVFHYNSGNDETDYIVSGKNLSIKTAKNYLYLKTNIPPKEMDDDTFGKLDKETAEAIF